MRIGLQKRGLLSFFLLVILVAGLAVAGCGDSGGKTVKIGMVYELTGNTASYGTSAANGAKLAFKAINAIGGVLGKQIQLITADNKGEPSESANAMTKVITQDKVVAVTGACAVVRRTVPGATAALIDRAAQFVGAARELDLDKPPGVAETIDWVAALVSLKVADLVDPAALMTLGALAKTPDDRTLIRDAYKSFAQCRLT